MRTLFAPTPLLPMSKKPVGKLRSNTPAVAETFPKPSIWRSGMPFFEHEWRENARARILFLVLDAPPHHEKRARVRRAIRQAAEQGIRIVPVAGSGIDKPTEFLMRFAATATGGTYAFLTDHSGIGNSHIKPTIGKHKVRKLNDLLVGIIGTYLE